MVRSWRGSGEELELELKLETESDLLGVFLELLGALLGARLLIILLNYTLDASISVFSFNIWYHMLQIYNNYLLLLLVVILTILKIEIFPLYFGILKNISF